MLQKYMNLRSVTERYEVSIGPLAEAAHKTSSGCPQYRKM